MRIIFLGTAGSTPTKSRSLPSMAIERNGELFVFDCGEGAQRQMMQFSVNISRVKAVFLTHTHGDHTLGIAGLVRTLALNRRTGSLDVYIPHGGEKTVEDLIKYDKAVLNYRINVKRISQGVIYKGRDFAISAFKVLHTVNTYGFVFKENDKLRFIKPKIKRLGLKGDLFATLLKNKHIKIKNKTIRLKDVTTRKIGKKVVYATDTRPTDSTLNATRNADIFIHESTYAEKEGKLARERKHSTAQEVARMARKANVKRLVLTHPSARYRNTDMLVNEARKIFKNTEMAEDGMVINL